ncbi:carbohydrate ABC transporter substrate-binding protein (CUT1 family) [Motilibacter rhizosphaerae]|uniref:Carbohydrate ABC transporter substrate-binding protein (CUT1 family) n=1 Tax=Motilibacter rhizosphaerae TaxID=598652 RepID=A0A4Q7NUM6_9ACTN|nr:extracellular solute-binding protein [Motilibacter rhizosphaerae]RZS90901.1 carbohydrate ABC transporter substrate-binding protein (CUT1 family) [Motilibacter rhizosphaerae]
MAQRRSPRYAGAAGAALLLTVAACGGGGGSSSASTATKDVTITVVLAVDPPPKATLDAFTAQTGIKVKWANIDWDSLQTKISAAATAHTYFADATDVDWSRVGQLGKLGWFLPMEKYLDTKGMAADVPQLASFTEGGHVVGIPYDASFMVTTVNTELLKKAGVTSTPTTIGQFTAAMEQAKAKGVVQYPLNIPFAAAEGLSTYWYQTTGAFGGAILDAQGKPQFTDPSSAGYKAAQWMVDALKKGLVPPGNINVLDSQSQQTLMAKGQVVSTFSDYSGNVGSLYDLPASSSVVKKVTYIPTPGATGVGPNLSNPDGIGIPKQAKYPAAAAKFISWFTDPANQVDFSGANGPDKALSGYAMPSHLSAVQRITAKGTLIGGDVLSTLLKDSKPVFPGGAPAWYPEFSNAVYTNLHDAATGSKSVAEAIKAIAALATARAGGS